MSCSKDKIKNPNTGRCVLKKGKIGREILNKRKNLNYTVCFGQKCGIKDKIDDFRVLIILKGIYLFHGFTHAKKISNKPTWFSDPNVSNMYSNSNKNCLTYRVKQKLTLIDLSFVNNIRKIYKSSNKEEKEVLSITTGFNITELEQEDDCCPKIDCSSYYDKPKTKLVFCPVGYYDYKTLKKGEYLNFVLAKIVCKLGFDGWFVPSGKILDTFTNEEYQNEVLLCNPKEKLENIKGVYCEDFL